MWASVVGDQACCARCRWLGKGRLGACREVRKRRVRLGVRWSSSMVGVVAVVHSVVVGGTRVQASAGTLCHKIQRAVGWGRGCL